MFPLFRRGRHNKNKSSSSVVPPIICRDKFTMPEEEHLHEGTWLQWPHDYGWDPHHVQRYEATWIAMTKALHTGERVHIIVYNISEQDRVQQLISPLVDDMSQIDFYTFPTDDVWVRDNGPIFVHDAQQELCITNWWFNAWGDKSEYYYDNYIPLKVGHALDLTVVDIPMVLEGGSIEVDGRGTLMAKRSSILNSNRNDGWVQADIERYLQHFLGVTNFIWLNGRKGGADNITDDHIDGTARFANGDTIVTYYKEDFESPQEYKVLQNAVDANGEPYKMVHLPCTKHKLKKVGDYGIYINFYVGNKVVLVPSFDDPHDALAVEKLERLYPTRKVVGIPCTELYCDGGLIHCVTQQQPTMERSSSR